MVLHDRIIRLVMDAVLIVMAVGSAILVKAWADTLTVEAPQGVNWNTIILAAIGLVGTMFSGILAVYLAKIAASTKMNQENTSKVVENTAATKSVVQDTAVQVVKVHDSVNSERSHMVDLVTSLRDEVLKLSLSNATLVEKERGSAQATAVREAAATPVQVLTPGVPVAPARTGAPTATGTIADPVHVEVKGTEPKKDGGTP